MDQTKGPPMQLSVSLALTDVGLNHEDQDLVERAKQDREAFALLYRRHHALIAGYIYRRLGNPHVTEDLVGEVFLAALRCLPRYRYRGLPIRAWLYRIAANTVNRWVRRERKSILQRFGGLTHSDFASQESAVEKQGDERRDGEFARLALLSLKPKLQSVLSLHYLEGLSLEETAAALGCRVGTVKSRLSRGRDALREKLVRCESRRVGGRGV